LKNIADEWAQLTTARARRGIVGVGHSPKPVHLGRIRRISLPKFKRI
jgi:hypothetical protein